MSNYTKATNFATKDSLNTGNPSKIVKGTEIDTEFNAISSAIASKADLASPTFTGTPAAPTATTGSNTTQLANTAYVKQELAAAGGRIVQSVTVSGGSGSTTSGSFTATSATATITPTSASSKILVLVSGMFWQTNGFGGNAFLTIFRNGSNVNSSSPMAMAAVPTGSNSFYGSTAITFLDSPATTSALTYIPYISADSGGTANWGSYSSSRITLLEIL